MRKINWQSFLKAGAALSIVAASFVATKALAYGTCYVRDNAGRSWNWTGPTPCVQAVQACNNWHAVRGYSAWNCMIVGGPPVPPPAPPVPPPVPPGPPVPPPAPPVVSGTCYVRDNVGRSWNWTSSSYNYSCQRALQACSNWHYNHGINNGNCWVQ